jgi:hypothetical protein
VTAAPAVHGGRRGGQRGDRLHRRADRLLGDTRRAHRVDRLSRLRARLRIGGRHPTALASVDGHRLDIVDKHHGLLLAPARHEAVTWGTPGEYDGQLVIDRFTDDGAEYRFVPDRPSDTGARAEMSLLVALGPGLPGAGLPVVTRLRGAARAPA